ncbi:glycosyltransferase involved in cell wall biosynthesis [Arthrobacter sp. BE255]|nr:glycosyltransferase involved in cell wall biosynthesis [Arthrobacter sp. BE255]
MTNSALKYNVAITTNTLCAGGAEKQRVLLANELTQLGHSVTLYCLQGFGPLAGQINDLVRLRKRPFWLGHPRGHDFVITGTTNTETAFAILGRAKSALRSARWMMAIHNPIGPTAPPLKSVTKLGLRLSDQRLALTTAHADALRTHWNVTVDSSVPNGLDLGWANHVRAKRKETSKFEYDIGYIGRISTHHKGLDLLFAALSRPPAADLTLAIAGSGPDEAELREAAIRLGIASRIVWLGHQEPESFLCRVNTLALFSRYEGQPLVLLEAQAGGVPVVASRTACAEPSTRVLVTDAEDADGAALALSSHSRLVGAYLEDTEEMPDSVAAMTRNYLEVMSRLQDRRRKPWKGFSFLSGARTELQNRLNSKAR